MLFADAIDTFKALAIPIGIGLAILLILAVPALRRSVFDSFKQGKESGERWREKKKPEEEKEDKP